MAERDPYSGTPPEGSEIRPSNSAKRAASEQLSSGPYPLTTFPPHSSGRSNDVVWIQSELKRLSHEKAGKDVVQAREQEITTQVDLLKEQLKGLTKCQRAEEFEDMKRAVEGWRTFFRNTVAVGSAGALAVIGGWLWQFYTLTGAVESTKADISEVNANVKELSEDYKGFKKEYYVGEVARTKELTEQLSKLEYRITDSISKASQGQTVKPATTNAYLQARRKELRQVISAAAPQLDDVQLDQVVDQALKNELKRTGKDQ
jgi:hypothetical protein